MPMSAVVSAPSFAPLDREDHLPCAVKPLPNLDQLTEDGMSVAGPEIGKAVCRGLNFTLEAVEFIEVQGELPRGDVGEFHCVASVVSMDC